MKVLAILVALACVAHAEAVTAVGAPAGLARAIETFLDGDCASAVIQIEDVARDLDAADPAAVRGRVQLWHAAILQRCDRLDAANRVLDTLVREQPEVRVDLGELWPSFAELVDAARARNAAVPSDDRAVIVNAETVVIERAGTQRAAPAPERAVSIGLSLIPTAGRETTVDDEQFDSIGSGLTASVLLDRGAWHAALASHVVRYAASEDAMAGGWDVGGALRIGTGAELGPRVAITVHGLVAASTERGGARDIDRLGLGLGSTLAVRATSKLRAIVAIDWLPVGVAAAEAADRADPNMSVLLGLGLGWQWTERWALELAATMDQHDIELRRGDEMARQSDMTIRLAFGARHRY